VTVTQSAWARGHGAARSVRGGRAAPTRMHRHDVPSVWAAAHVPQRMGPGVSPLTPGRPSAPWPASGEGGAVFNPLGQPACARARRPQEVYAAAMAELNEGDHSKALSKVWPCSSSSSSSGSGSSGSDGRALGAVGLKRRPFARPAGGAPAPCTHPATRRLPQAVPAPPPHPPPPPAAPGPVAPTCPPSLPPFQQPAGPFFTHGGRQPQAA
jgi:hypothetical protein